MTGEVLRVEPDMLMQEVALGPAPTNVIAFGSERKVQIEAVLRETRGKVYGPEGAAARLGLPATTLDSQIRSFSINKHQFK